MLPSTFEVFGAVPSLRYANRCGAGRPPETGGKTRHGVGQALGHGFVEVIDMNIYQYGNRVGSSGSPTCLSGCVRYGSFGYRVESAGSPAPAWPMRQYTSLATVSNNGFPASATQDGMSPSDTDLRRLQIPHQQRYKAHVTALATCAATKIDERKST